MGAQLRVYRQKIKSAQTTKKITRAMELISASRINRAQQRLAAASPYAKAVTRAVSAVATFSNVDHPLTRQDISTNVAGIVIFCSDRGLAGAFSSNVLRQAEELTNLLTSEGKQVRFYLVGRKSVNFFNYRKRVFSSSWIGSTDLPVFATAREISSRLLADFTSTDPKQQIGEVHLVYNKFISMIAQTPQVVRLLPLEVVDEIAAPNANEIFPLYEFEPEAAKVLDALLPVYVESRIFNSMLQSAAAEHAARQKAMKSATDNADKLIKNYTRLSNAARQSEITQQISEIVGGADALAASAKAD